MSRVLWTLTLAVGVWLFASGFLLTRLQLDDVSITNMAPSGIRGWPAASYKRVVIVIIDALRWDMGRDMPVVRRMAESKHMVALPFWSDPPTTTAQRLKGMTTGSLPTFIDVSRNFASANITEDNWLDQAVRHGKRVTFMGDDTWLSMFPGRFRKSFPYPSFNVRDLHTVDNGVLEHLVPEFLLPDDWDILIAHFLGVDHAGHTHGPQHPAMVAKLAQMNAMLEDLIKHITDPDTLLIVLGDHGMTATGNHGGASDDELSSTLLLYSARGFVKNQQRSSPLPVPQINLVPSLSVVLGIPIPFGNLGALIPELFQDAHQSYATALQVNAWQVQTFLSAYTQARSDFPLSMVDSLQGQLSEAQALFLRSPPGAIPLFELYLREASRMCRDAWATFHVPLMVAGLCIQGASMMLLWIFLAGGDPVFMGWDIVLLYAIGGSLGCALLWESSPPWMMAAAAAMVQGRHLAQLFAFRLRFIVRVSFRTWLAVCAVGLHGVGLFSNSFIEAEYQVSKFLLTAFLLWETSSWSWMAAVILLSCDLVAAGTVHPFLLLGGAFVFCLLVLRRSPVLAVAAGALIALHFGVRTLDPQLFASSSLARLYIPRIVYAMAAWLFCFGQKREALLLLTLLVQGPQNVMICIWFSLQLELFDRNRKPWGSRAPFAEAAILVFLARIFFYASGHGCDFATLDFDSGFIGFDHAHHAVAGALIAFNALCPFLVLLTFRNPWVSNIVMLDAFLTSVFVFGARRHLMVWRVFAPKFVYDTLVMLVIAIPTAMAQS